ncbi:PREDICTED: basic proline-rich protein-like [Lepidothrix coronata]|uniref:Basic proline-rich protein-like n=1 Tax=Lepidothrix coronata TaxID=321398 RepID=A0A6J0J2S2_9PASS|nr:PREDICTED: basic proline-rich protein-like [Lepidothrix coronata]
MWGVHGAVTPSTPPHPPFQVPPQTQVLPVLPLPRVDSPPHLPGWRCRAGTGRAGRRPRSRRAGSAPISSERGGGGGLAGIRLGGGHRRPPALPLPRGRSSTHPLLRVLRGRVRGQGHRPAPPALPPDCECGSLQNLRGKEGAAGTAPYTRDTHPLPRHPSQGPSEAGTGAVRGCPHGHPTPRAEAGKRGPAGCSAGGGRGQPAKRLGRHPRPQRARLPPKPGSPPPAGLSEKGAGQPMAGSRRHPALLPPGALARAIAAHGPLWMGPLVGTSSPSPLSSDTLPPKRCRGGRASRQPALLLPVTAPASPLPPHQSQSLPRAAASAPLTSPNTGTGSAGTATTTTTIITTILTTTISVSITIVIIATPATPRPSRQYPAHLCRCRPGRTAQLAPAPTRYIARRARAAHVRGRQAAPLPARAPLAPAPPLGRGAAPTPAAPGTLRVPLARPVSPGRSVPGERQAAPGGALPPLPPPAASRCPGTSPSPRAHPAPSPRSAPPAPRPAGTAAAPPAAARAPRGSACPPRGGAAAGPPMGARGAAAACGGHGCKHGPAPPRARDRRRGCQEPRHRPPAPRTPPRCCGTGTLTPCRLSHPTAHGWAEEEAQG